MIIRLIALFAVTTTQLHALQELTTEHVDISVNFSASLLGSATNPWRITARDEDARHEYGGVRVSSDDETLAVLYAFENSKVEVPNDSRYTFLGPVGSELYILPQTLEPDMLYLGLSSENKTSQTGWVGHGVEAGLLVRGFTTGTFQSNRVNLRLATFTGPGDFFLYSTNAFGDPTIFYNTANGLALDDNRQLSPGNHSHFNWAFTEAGEYTIGLRASATTTGGTFTESELTEFTFNVVPEPSSAALLALSGLALLRRPFRSRNQNKTTLP